MILRNCGESDLLVLSGTTNCSGVPGMLPTSAVVCSAGSGTARGSPHRREFLRSVYTRCTKSGQGQVPPEASYLVCDKNSYEYDPLPCSAALRMASFRVHRVCSWKTGRSFSPAAAAVASARRRVAAAPRTAASGAARLGEAMRTKKLAD